MMQVHAKHALDESGNDQVLVIRSPSGNTDAIVMATVHHPTECVIIDSGNGKSRNMILCDQNNEFIIGNDNIDNVQQRQVSTHSLNVIMHPHFSAKEKLLH